MAFLAFLYHVSQDWYPARISAPAAGWNPVDAVGLNLCRAPFLASQPMLPLAQATPRTDLKKATA